MIVKPARLVSYLLLSWPISVCAMGPARLAEMRKATVDVFQHGFNNYMEHAFPEDELRPVSCTPLSRDPSNPANYDLNDVLGNYSLTLIDSLSTLAILAGTPSDEETSAWALNEFQGGIAKFVENYGHGRQGPAGDGVRAHGFDLDSKVQVFETVIRGVGGLLSAHLFAVGELPIPGYHPATGRAQDGPDENDPLEVPPIAWPNGFRYDGQLLRLALDLAERLLPAFYTPTGLPYPRVNLRHGIPFYVNSPLHKRSTDDADTTQRSREKTDTCSAGAGSLVLEFTVLSRLTGDPRFEHLAKRAFWAVWKSKSDIGLVGNAIDPEKGEWVSFDTGIGAGVDSFFEYALKSHILLSGQDLVNLTTRAPPQGRGWLDPNTLHTDPLTPAEHTSGAFLEAWHQAHAAIKRHLYNDVHHPYYMTGHRTRGYPLTAWVDSLAAFYPGLLAMAGEVEEGQEANLLYTALWTRYGALPERWSVRERQIDSGIGWWPGRPEFIESTYYLYRATNDPWHLHVGEMVLADVNRLCKTKCGWSGLQNVDTGEKADRMQSFFLGETTKYLYLLFDPDHPFNKLDKAFVFSTEAHPLIIPRQRSKSHNSQRRRTSNRGFEDVAVYYDEEFTNTCPVPAKEAPLTGSALASRTDVFHAASFVNLHKTANPYSGVEAVPARGKDLENNNNTIFRYRENHTFFPWTLPATMLPENGTCAALAFKPTLLIEFPPTQQQVQNAGSALNQLLANSAAFKTPMGVKIHSLNGLKVTFVREESFDSHYDFTWRVTHVNHLALGKDEIVHVDAGLLAGVNDPLFSRVRFPSYADLVLVYDDRPEENATVEFPADETFEVRLDGQGTHIRLADSSSDGTDQNDGSWPDEQEGAVTGSQSLDPSYKSMLKSFVRAVTSVFDPAYTPSPPQPDRVAGPSLHVERYKAALPVGRGAVPLPDVPDAALGRLLAETSSPSSSSSSSSSHASTAKTPLNLPWSSVYLAGEACDGRLPDEAPREHHVIAMRRGGCSFSAKLANIPAFTPSERSLQLVVVVDDSDLDFADTSPADGAEGVAGEDASFFLNDDGGDLSEEEKRAMVYGAQPGSQPWEVAADMVKPFLEDEQRTPAGMPRHRPVSMVMIRGGRGLAGSRQPQSDGGGGTSGGAEGESMEGETARARELREEGAYEQLARSKGIGVRRKYFIETQGRRVDNIIVL